MTTIRVLCRDEGAESMRTTSSTARGITRDCSATVPVQTTTQYLQGGYQYIDGNLAFVPHAEGFVKMENGVTYFYNYTDHLGNVCATYTDNPDAGGVQLTEESHYYPFGSLIPNRHGSSTAYRYGFNGKEKDNELKGEGNSYDFGARMLDTRIGRWFAPDPKEKKYAAFSTYNFSLNSPIMLNDPNGEDPLTGIIEALTAFGIEAGMDFVNAMIFDKASIEQAFESINWWSATWEGTKAYGIAAFSPPGTSTIVRFNKLAKNKAFIFTANVVGNMIEQTTTKFMNGEFVDEKGELSIEVAKEQFKIIFTTALVEELIGEKMGKKADELIEYVKLTDIKYAKKLQKLKNKIEAGDSEKRINKYRKKVIALNEEAGKALNKRIREKTKNEVVTKTASKEAENIVKGDKDEEKKSN